MRIGVFAVLFGDKPFEETLDYLKELRGLSGERALQARGAARGRWQAEGLRQGRREAGARDQRAELSRQSPSSRLEDGV